MQVEQMVKDAKGFNKKDFVDVKIWGNELVDTTIQTFIINEEYFFVIYGFKKSHKKLDNGQWG